MYGSLRAMGSTVAGGSKGLPAISLGQYSQAGTKGANQDFHGSLVPEGAALLTKGIAVAIADGISTSEVGARASEIAVKSFLTDYYCTPEGWSAKTSGERVIRAANSWLHGQNGRVLVDEERDRGHVCAFSALVLKSRSAYIFHVGDCRISRLGKGGLEPLTEEHRAYVSSKEIYLARALGADRNVEVDYRSVTLQRGDIFVLSTDGVHDHVPPAEAAQTISNHLPDLDAAAEALVRRAAELGSTDDLTVQIVLVNELAEGTAGELMKERRGLPPAPALQPRQLFEGFEILRTIHSNSRSHIYLARDMPSGALVALKVPSTELREDADHMRRFALEEWVAQRVSSPHVLSAAAIDRPRSHLFVATDYLEGVSLDQWMRDNPRPGVEAVRRIVEQIGRGLHAFHRREMLHQDLRPPNVILDKSGTAKIIDFGSAWIAGVAEAALGEASLQMMGTVQYSAPEYLLGEAPDERADIFSLGVICYEMLTGALPFGPRRVQPRDTRAVRKLRYISARRLNPAVPDWLDATLAKAVAPDREQRYEVVSEFLHDLRHANPALPLPERGPLLQRRPELGAWVVVAFMTVALILLGWRNAQLARELREARSAVSQPPAGKQFN